MNNINELRSLDMPTLKKKLDELRGQLFVLQFQIASGKSNKFSDVKKFKKQIARILTIFQAHKRKKEKNDITTEEKQKK